MGLIRIISVGAAAFVVAGSAVYAQQSHTGTITQINRLNNTIAIRQTQNGTVGANAAGAVEEFKAGNGISLETLHAGDRVSYSESEADGAKTITKIDRQQQ
jgi:hypothetical protein